MTGQGDPGGDGGLIPWPEQVEHPPKLGALPVRSRRLLAKDVAVVHARLGQGLQLNDQS